METATENNDNTWVNAKGERRSLFRRDKEVTPEQNDKDAAAFRLLNPGTTETRIKPEIDMSKLRTGISQGYQPEILEQKTK